MLHAVWNALVKSSGDRLTANAGVSMGGAIANVPILAIAGLPDRDVWAIAALSAAIHVGYVLLLAAAYDRSDLSVAYPIARGTAPLIVAIAGIVALDDDVGAVGLLGVLGVTFGLMVLASTRGWRDTRWAVATGIAIAGYTVVDGWGVRRGDDSLRFIGTVFVLHAAAIALIVVVRRGLRPTLDVLSRQRWQLLFGGAASAGAYLLVMTAAKTEPLGLVAGLRETSVVIGALIGWRFLGEHIGRRHAIAVVLVAMGAIAISQG